MRILKIVCERGFYGKMRALKLMVDGNEVGSIKQGEEREIKLSDEAIEFRGKMDWGKTEPISLTDVKDGDVVTLQPYFTLNLLRSLGLMTLPVKVHISPS